MATIHPTAIVSPSAEIHPSATIGAFCLIGDNVQIGADSVLLSHVVVKKNTRIGARNTIYQFASIGEDPQDLKFKGEESFVVIGDDNTIREACTIHRGTADGIGKTVIGNHNLLMVNTHIAHDCVLGNHSILANNVGVAGHVTIGDYVTIGGNSGIHQFCRIDSYAMVAGASLILKDVAAFVTVGGNPATVKGLNKEGMRRKGWDKQTMTDIETAYRLIFHSGLIKQEVLTALLPLIASTPKVQLLADSLAHSSRGLIRPRNNQSRATSA